MFNKDPIVYANPHPAEQDFGYVGGHPNNQKNASLRVRSDPPSMNATGEEASSSALDVRTSSGFAPQQAQMRFQDLPNRSDFSPSGMASGFSERESPVRYQPGAPDGQQRAAPNDLHASNRPSQIMSKSRITNHTKYPNNQSYDQVVMFKSEGLDNSQAQVATQPKSFARGYQEAPNGEEFNTSRFSGLPAAASQYPGGRRSNVTAEQSSSALIDEPGYSGKQNVTNPFTQTTVHPASTHVGRTGPFIDQNSGQYEAQAQQRYQGSERPPVDVKQGDTSYTYTLQQPMHGQPTQQAPSTAAFGPIHQY